MELDSEYFYDESLIFDNFYEGNAIFIKYWYSNYTSLYTASPLPGGKEGITGTVISTYNIAINNYSEKQKKKASIEALKYITSKEVHKKYIIEEEIYSPMSKLYEDDEVCENVDCEIIKSIQPFTVVNFCQDIDIDVTDINDYIRKYREYVYDYINGNITVSDVINNIENLSKFYYYSYKPNELFIGFIIIVITCITGVVMALLLNFLFINEYKKVFKFLTYDFWIIFDIGCIFILFSIFTYYGELKSIKCQIRRSLRSFGLLFCLIPILYRLIHDIPEKNNKLSQWINKRRYDFFFILVTINAILNALSFLPSYDLENIIIDDGKNFKICSMSNYFGRIMLIIILLYEFILILCILVLLFIEWNLEETSYDLKFILSAICMNILFYIMNFIFECIRIKQFIVYYFIHIIIVYFSSFSIFTLIYGSKIIRHNLKPTEKEKFLNKMMSEEYENDINRKSLFFMNRSKSFSHHKNEISFANMSNKLFEYHYKKTADQIDIHMQEFNSSF